MEDGYGRRAAPDFEGFEMRTVLRSDFRLPVLFNFVIVDIEEADSFLKEVPGPGLDCSVAFYAFWTITFLLLILSVGLISS